VTITQVTITLRDLPPSPNRTRRVTNWAARAALIRAWRNDSWHAALEAHDNFPPKWERVRVAIHFVLPDKRKRDMPNLIGSEAVKGLIDGLVDAGVMTGDDMSVLAEYGPFTWEYRKGKRATVVTVTPLVWVA